MKNQNQFKNRFSQYLQKKLTNHQKDKIFKGEFNENKEKRVKGKLFDFEQPSCNLYIKKNRNNQTQNSFNSRNDYSEHYNFQNSSSKKVTVKAKAQQNNIQLKRLKKMRELQENVCAICIQQIKNRSKMECRHEFCNQCLTQWFQTSNNCPICRKQSNHYWCKGEKIKIPKVQRRSQQIEMQFESDIDEQQSLDYLCYNCDKTDIGDIVLICDRCQLNSCHVECDQSLLGIEPVGEWYCHFCRH